MLRMMDKNILLNILFLFITSTFVGLDVMTDIQEGLPMRHYLHEVALITGCFGWIGAQIYLILRRDKKLSMILNSLKRVEDERDFYLNKVSHFKAQFNDLIDEQFKLWGLSIGERDVAILLIKGLTMKEIADLRQTAEGTVRQQAQNIYKKSHLHSRQQLSAYFLDDLFAET